LPKHTARYQTGYSTNLIDNSIVIIDWKADGIADVSERPRSVCIRNMHQRYSDNLAENKPAGDGAGSLPEPIDQSKDNEIVSVSIALSGCLKYWSLQ